MAIAPEKWAVRRPAPRPDFVLLCVAAVVANSRALAEGDLDVDHIKSRTVAISVMYHDGQDWKPYENGLGTGFLVHPDGYLLTAKHVAPAELIDDPNRLSKLRVFGRIGERSAGKMELQIIDVHPRRDAMLLKLDPQSDRKPYDYLELTDKFTLPLLQVSAAGFPALGDGKLRIVTAHMTSPLREGEHLGEVGAKLGGGFSGGPVLSGEEVVGMVESSSTLGQNDTYNFVAIRSVKAWLSENISLPKRPERSQQVKRRWAGKAGINKTPPRPVGRSCDLL